MRIATRSAIPVTIVSRGEDLNVSGVTMRILNPITNKDPGSANNSSVVMKVEYGSRSLLMTGDIERTTEADLVANDCEGIRADVLKVAHHGSRTSSTPACVKCSAPSIAVISVGRRSRFGHPHAEVVERLTGSGAEILRTGEKGTITITIDSDTIKTQTFIP